MVAEGFSPLMKSVLTFCCLLGAVLGMTRQSHSEKMMPREMVAAVSHLGTPTLACRQETQSDQLLGRDQSVDSNTEISDWCQVTVQP